ncbi:MAG TPA: hypothetical protein PLI96_07570 [Halothiobacillus sp.]|nr:hypothetical protein [Halothiobacillus sp.]
MKRDTKIIRGKFHHLWTLDYLRDEERADGFEFEFSEHVWDFLDEMFCNLEKKDLDLLTGDIYWQTRAFYKRSCDIARARDNGKAHEKLERLIKALNEVENALYAVRSDPTAKSALDEADEGYRLLLLIKDHRENEEFKILERKYKELGNNFENWIFDANADETKVSEYLSRTKKEEGIDDCDRLSAIWDRDEVVPLEEIYPSMEESYKRLNDDLKRDVFSQLRFEKIPPVDSPVFGLHPDAPWGEMTRRRLFIREAANRYKPKRGNQVDQTTRFFIQQIASFIKRDCGDSFKISYAENSRFTQLIDKLFLAADVELSPEGVSARIKVAIKNQG